MNHCLNLNPNYKVILWNEKMILDLFRTHYPWFKLTYDTYKFSIQKSDAARYFIVYHYGGFYIDLDMRCVQSFDEIVQNISKTHPRVDFVAASERKRILTGFSGHFQLMNGFMGGSPKHPLMLEAISNLQSSNRFFLTYRRSILLSAGAWYFARIFDKYPCKEHVFPLSENEYLNGVFLHHSEMNSWHTLGGNMVHYLWVVIHVITTLAYIFFAFKVVCHLYNVKVNIQEQVCQRKVYSLFIFISISYICSYVLWLVGVI